MRCTVDAYVYYRIIKKYKYQKILEIGFYEGQTAGLLAEITDPTAHVTCVDPMPQTRLLDAIYQDLKHKISLETIKSEHFSFETYDFIVIDGDKNFDTVSHDIRNSAANLNQGGMILVNEYQKSDVSVALLQHMMPTGLVPFLRTDQTLFFHRSSDDRGDFLDFDLVVPGQQFMRFENLQLWGHSVLNATTLPIFSDRMDFFDLALKEFDV